MSVMKLAYFHVAQDVPEHLVPESAVVIDVLRATTTIACALNNGAEAVQTFADLEELRNTASLWPVKDRLLLGERGGNRIAGFDLGNSPVDVVESLVSGKRLFMSTTNGTRSIHKVRKAKSLYTLALPNRMAVAQKLLQDQPNEVWIVGSGWEGAYSLEDSLAAGALTSFLQQEANEATHVENDELNSALALWEKWKDDPEGCLRKASHGQRLMSIGNHDEDFKCCAGLDNLSIVPTQQEEGVICAG